MRHLGLIIGVNQYQDSTFHPLQFAENDARALAQWLVNAKGGKWAPPDVQLAQGSHVTRELVESLLTQVCITSAEADDIILLYFAGHAYVDERSGEGHLALTNTNYANASSGLSVHTLMHQFMVRSRAAQILCILDCFQSGPIWQSRRASPYDSKPLLGQAVLNTLQQGPNRLFLCSCRGSNTAPENGERQLGAFTHNLILGLCGPARESTTGNVTLPKLHGFLFNKLTEQHRPQLFGQQNPPLVLVGDLSKMNAQQTASPTPAVPPSPPGGLSSQGSGLLSRQRTQQATISTQTPPSSIGPSTSRIQRPAALDEHRQQQCRQMVAQAQQLLQIQSYGPAFDLVEKALQLVPTDTEALTLKAQLLGTAGRFSEALAIIEQILHREPENALIWSMQAAVLSNMGQHQQAIAAIERSLELDPQNPETYGLKTTIMAGMAAQQAQTQAGSPSPFAPRSSENQLPVRENPRSFAIGAGLHLLGLICGAVGCGMLFVQSIPQFVGLILASFGLALLCINAARGAFRYGLSRLGLTILTTLLLGAILGIGYKLASARIMQTIVATPAKTLIPTLFIVAWLAVAAVVPLLLGIFGLLGRQIARARKRS